MRSWLVLFLLLSSSTFAHVSVKGAIVNDNHCQYFSSVTGYFSVFFDDSKGMTRWGDKVYLLYGYKDHSSGRPWMNFQKLEMLPNAPYVWRADFEEKVNTRGSFAYSQLNFVIEIKHQDGSSAYVKGNDSSYGYFSTDFPEVKCEVPDVLDDLFVRTVIQY